MVCVMYGWSQELRIYAQGLPMIKPSHAAAYSREDSPAKWRFHAQIATSWGYSMFGTCQNSCLKKESITALNRHDLVHSFISWKLCVHIMHVHPYQCRAGFDPRVLGQAVTQDETKFDISFVNICYQSSWVFTELVLNRTDILLVQGHEQAYLFTLSSRSKHALFFMPTSVALTRLLRDVDFSIKTIAVTCRVSQLLNCLACGVDWTV